MRTRNTAIPGMIARYARKIGKSYRIDARSGPMTMFEVPELNQNRNLSIQIPRL
ncbi:hypothetical protein D3C80_2197900 [compost metagenome]